MRIVIRTGGEEDCNGVTDGDEGTGTAARDTGRWSTAVYGASGAAVDSSATNDWLEQCDAVF